MVNVEEKCENGENKCNSMGNRGKEKYKQNGMKTAIINEQANLCLN